MRETERQMRIRESKQRLFSVCFDLVSPRPNLFFVSSSLQLPTTASPTRSSPSAPSALAACFWARGPPSRALLGSRLPTAAQPWRAFRSSPPRPALGERRRRQRRQRVWFRRRREPRQRTLSSSRCPLPPPTASAPSSCSPWQLRTWRRSQPPAPSWPRNSEGEEEEEKVVKKFRRHCCCPLLRRLLLDEERAKMTL